MCKCFSHIARTKAVMGQRWSNLSGQHSPRQGHTAGRGGNFENLSQVSKPEEAEKS
jgi:hypothetical protein